MKWKTFFLWNLSVLAVFGCSSMEPIAEDERIGILASVTLSPTHSIDFVEFEPGVPAIIERRNVDKDRQLIDFNNGRSLTSAYKALRPNEPLPQSLRNADERAASRANILDKLPEPLPSTHGTKVDLQASTETAPPPTHPTTTNLKGYWKDWISDAQWFLNNFCNTGQNRWCPTNVNGWAYSGPKYNTTWFQSTGFAQGFNSTAHFWVQYRSCSGAAWWYSCSWKIPSNGVYWLQPRHLVTITWTSAGSRWAGIDQSTDRVGLAALWNTAGTPSGPTSNPGPCNDPGEFCCSSYNQWGGASFYCNGNVACQSGICVTP